MKPPDLTLLDHITCLLGDKLKHSVAAFPNEKFSDLKPMCFLFAGLKRVAPEADPQMDLEDAYLQASEVLNNPTS